MSQNLLFEEMTIEATGKIKEKPKLKCLNVPEFDISVTTKRKIRFDGLFNLSQSADVAELLMKCYNEGAMLFQEQFIVLFLNRSNKVIGYYHASSGGLTGAIADTRIIFMAALQIPGCASLIVSHNHPSGGLRPSRADEELTQKISNAGKIMEIKLLDHVIVNSEGEYYSFADDGKIY